MGVHKGSFMPFGDVWRLRKSICEQYNYFWFERMATAIPLALDGGLR